MRIRHETTGDQLRYLLAKLSALMREYPELDDGDAKLVGFGPYFLEIQIRAFAATTDWARFKEIRQDVFLKAMAIVEEAGSALAVRSQVQYAPEELRPDPDRVRQVERLVAEWREREELPIPELSGSSSELVSTESGPEGTSPEGDPPRHG